MTDPFVTATNSTRPRRDPELSWEESAVDSLSYVEGFSNPERPAPKTLWLWVVLFVVFGTMFGKLFYLQVVMGARYRELSESNRIRSQTVLAPRGYIRDRNGQILAQNTASFNLVLVPFDLPKEGTEELFTKLSETFSVDLGELRRLATSVARASFDPVVIKQDLSPEEGIRFETRRQEFPGFAVQENPIREYVSPEIFSHVLGYTGLVSPEDLRDLPAGRYAASDYTGKLGIELGYERFLHGKNGEHQVEVDATGKVIKVLGQSPPAPGDTVSLNLDKGLQEELYRAFRSRAGSGGRGAAVVLDPRNGEVLALLSFPGFDNNLFAHGIKRADYQRLTQDKALPLFNRAVSGTYPPGSTVKPMVATAALEEGVINENTVITDRGVLVIPNQFDPSVSYNFYGWKRTGLGPMNVRSAIAESSDIFFYVVSGGHPSSPVKGLGIERLARWYRRFGVGAQTGIDLAGEKPGLVPDPAWKTQHFKNNRILSQWYLGDTYHVGIGQGDMLVTPLQVAVWTAAVANGGTAYRPTLLRSVADGSGREIFKSNPEPLVVRVASEHTVKVVQEGMRQTVLSGSGRQLMDLSVSSAGKTGTSQFDGSDPSRTHAWFTAYAPFENPEVVVTVLVEAGGEGHAAAVPIAKDILSWWSENRRNP